MADGVTWGGGAVYGYCTNYDDRRALGQPTNYVEFYDFYHNWAGGTDKGYALTNSHEFNQAFLVNKQITWTVTISQSQIRNYVVICMDPAGGAWTYIGGGSGKVIACSGYVRNLFTPNYNIAFNGNGATSGSTAAMNNCVYGTTYNLRANGFAKTGYRFNGWSGSNGKNYSNQQSVSNLSTTGGTITMSAKWAANKYTVTYNGNGATGGSMNASSHTYDTEAALTANAYTKTGYRFAGWSKSVTGTVAYANRASVKNLTATHNGNVTLYAVWEPVVYNVTLDGRGANNKYTNSVSVKYNKMMPTLGVVPEKKYTITYNANGGICDIASEVVSSQFLGYFSGLDGTGNQYYDKLGKGTRNYKLTSNTTLYAHYQTGQVNLPNVLQKNYHVNFVVDDTITVTSGSVSQDGNYSFDGWYTPINGGEKIVSPYTPTGNVTLYAHWTDNRIILPKVEKQGAVFIGWFTKPQSLETLTDCTYYGGGIDAEMKIVDDEKTYSYGGGGTDWDYSTKVSFGLENGSTLTLYPWFNKMPEYENSFDEYDDLTDGDTNAYSIIAYEDQQVSYSQLLSFIDVRDYEDDYTKALEEDYNLEEAIIKQTNPENMKLKITKIEYNRDGGYSSEGSYVAEDISEGLDTSKENIGTFTITYKITDDGITQMANLHTPVTLSIRKKGKILFNNIPSVSCITRFMLVNDENLTKNNVEDYLKQGHTVTDVEDDMNILPYWISGDYSSLNDNEKAFYDKYNQIQNIVDENCQTKTNVKKDMEDTLSIISISDIHFNSQYDLENPDIVTEWKKINSLEELFTYRESHMEEFKNITSFKIHIQVHDQFGKVNDPETTFSDVLILDESLDADMLEANISSYTRYIDPSKTALQDNSVWSTEYYDSLLNNAFDKYQSKESLLPVTYSAAYTKRINNKDVEIPVVINVY